MNNNNFAMFQSNFMMMNQLNQMNQINQQNQMQIFKTFYQMNQNAPLTLMDGFNYNKNKKNNFNNQNQICCEFCKRRSDAVEYSTFYSLSDILIINLNRGKNNMYKVPINIAETLDLNNEVEAKIDNNIYDLISVITHFGNSGTDGHYISFCKIQDKNKWYKFNDSIVTESNYQEASTTGDAYILFYQRRKN
jgi:ubiquitin C-terminal hydrolase